MASFCLSGGFWSVVHFNGRAGMCRHTCLCTPCILLGPSDSTPTSKALLTTVWLAQWHAETITSTLIGNAGVADSTYLAMSVYQKLCRVAHPGEALKVMQIFKATVLMLVASTMYRTHKLCIELYRLHTYPMHCVE